MVDGASSVQSTTWFGACKWRGLVVLERAMVPALERWDVLGKRDSSCIDYNRQYILIIQEILNLQRQSHVRGRFFQVQVFGENLHMRNF